MKTYSEILDGLSRKKPPEDQDRHPKSESKVPPVGSCGTDNPDVTAFARPPIVYRNGLP